MWAAPKRVKSYNSLQVSQYEIEEASPHVIPLHIFEKYSRTKIRESYCTKFTAQILGIPAAQNLERQTQRWRKPIKTSELLLIFGSMPLSPNSLYFLMFYLLLF